MKIFWALFGGFCWVFAAGLWLSSWPLWPLFWLTARNDRRLARELLARKEQRERETREDAAIMSDQERVEWEMCEEAERREQAEQEKRYEEATLYMQDLIRWEMWEEGVWRAWPETED